MLTMEQSLQAICTHDQYFPKNMNESNPKHVICPLVVYPFLGKVIESRRLSGWLSHAGVKPGLIPEVLYFLFCQNIQ